MSDEVVDIAGIGFGPSNLALAIAIEEHNRDVAPTRRLTARFIEAKPHFDWHPGMLLPGAMMQISFLKDLVTQRNVRSRYSFLNYLTEHGRLTDFINLQSFRPTRLEFLDYLRWAARTVNADVHYGTRAVGATSTGDSFEIRLDGRATGVVAARNIVMGVGLSARLPHGVTASERVFHNHGLLPRLAALPPVRHGRFLVIGAGQSAAEVVGYLHGRYPEAEVHAVFGKYGLSPADDSPYANRIFDPAAVDDFYSASPQLRQKLMDYHRGTNYSAVEPTLIEQLYAHEYSERVAGQRRLFMHGASSVSRIDAYDGGVRVDVTHGPTELTETLDCDAVVCATGFRPGDVREVLGELAESVAFDDDRVQVARDYRLIPTAPLPGGVYLQGGTEHTHGISSSLLSNIAVRTGEIVGSIARSTAQADRSGAPAGRQHA
ncbi:lysine N(6)-hydroxylase/L-ornithine N(5)-oxygenase family protein [Nocardia sp. NPDC051570]|uniref:lysine N(6)-hydroxylase/L-ornithine N(5)-oxygenase family protein n=1 Tax=Nocardia sp. NPDC051570 TaxID=3364324 RepID=UPI0037A2DA07